MVHEGKGRLVHDTTRAIRIEAAKILDNSNGAIDADGRRTASVSRCCTKMSWSLRFLIILQSQKCCLTEITIQKKELKEVKEKPNEAVEAEAEAEA